MLNLFSFVHKTEEEKNSRSNRRLIKGLFVFLSTFQRSLFRAMGEYVYSLQRKKYLSVVISTRCPHLPLLLPNCILRT